MRCGNIQCKTNKRAKYVLAADQCYRYNKRTGTGVAEDIGVTEYIFACERCRNHDLPVERREQGGLIWELERRIR